MFLPKLFGVFYRNLYRPVLFSQDPEKVHDTFTLIGNTLGKTKLSKKFTSILFGYKNPRLHQTVSGVRFTNPVGLAAGFDKDANLVSILDDVGFGFMQIGSITDKPYEGNPPPRLYRLKKSKALIVYYGLKNLGAEKIIEKIQRAPNLDPHFPISVSIAKTNCDETASIEGGVADYTACLEKVVAADIGHFYTINISCPNTFGGEPFTTPDRLEKLLASLTKVKRSKPMYVKMPINVKWPEFKKLTDVILKYKLDGVIIGNLTKDRESPLIKDDIPESIKGGISGKPTEPLNNELISQTYAEYGDKLIIIGVGGIFSAEDAYDKIKRGASLVQLITGIIYQGPQLIGEINRGLVQLLQADGYSNISEAIGAYHRES